MKPKYSAAAQRVSKANLGILGAVDATRCENLSQKYKVNGFPTLKLFQKGSYKADFHGARTADNIYKFMETNRPKGKDEL